MPSVLHLSCVARWKLIWSTPRWTHHLLFSVVTMPKLYGEAYVTPVTGPVDFHFFDSITMQRFSLKPNRLPSPF